MSIERSPSICHIAVCCKHITKTKIFPLEIYLSPQTIKPGHVPVHIYPSEQQ